MKNHRPRLGRKPRVYTRTELDSEQARELGYLRMKGFHLVRVHVDSYLSGMWTMGSYSREPYAVVRTMGAAVAYLATAQLGGVNRLRVSIGIPELAELAGVSPTTAQRAMGLLRNTLRMVDRPVRGTEGNGVSQYQLPLQVVKDLARRVRGAGKSAARRGQEWMKAIAPQRNRNQHVSTGHVVSTLSAPLTEGGATAGVTEPPARYEPATRAEIDEARALYLLLMEGKRIVAAEQRAGSA